MTPPPPPPPDPEQVRDAFRSVMEFCSAYDKYKAELDSLTVILDRLSASEKLTDRQVAQLNAVKKEYARTVTDPREGDPDEYEDMDGADALRFAIQHMAADIDRNDCRVLEAISEAAERAWKVRGERLKKAASVRVHEFMSNLYIEVQAGLDDTEQRRRVVEAFADEQIPLEEKHMTRLVRTREQIKEDGGPKETATLAVAFVFDTSENPLRERRQRAELPRGTAFTDAAKYSSAVQTTQYALRALQWPESVVQAFPLLVLQDSKKAT